MVDTISMEDIRATAGSLGIDLSSVDWDSIHLPPGEDFGIKSDYEDLYEEDSLEFEEHIEQNSDLMDESNFSNDGEEICSDQEQTLPIVFKRQTNLGYQNQQIVLGQFMGINSGPMIAGHSQGLQPQLQNQQESMVSNSGRTQLQAWNVENKYGLPARSNADFIPQVYSSSPNELSPWQVALTPWQHHGLREQQPAVLTAKSFGMPDSQRRVGHISCSPNEGISSPSIASVLGESLRPASVTTAQVNSAGTVANYAIHSCSKRDQQIASRTGQELSEAIKIVAAGTAEDLNGKTTFRVNDVRNQSLLNKKKVWTEQSLEHFCSNTMNDLADLPLLT